MEAIIEELLITAEESSEAAADPAATPHISL